MKLTVIDQSPVQLGSVDNRPAPLLSAKLAKYCEQWGYGRYWLAEHHNASYFSGPAPEVLISHIASVTSKIRVGSGGVMLSHYSPYKVAEQFRLLATLFPGRIDLGIGRAPGGDQMASEALAYPGRASHGEVYSRQALDLKSYFDGNFDADHPFKRLKTSPYDGNNPELWMLGTSGGSAELAGYLGMNLSLGLFIAPSGQTTAITDSYKNAYEKAGHENDAKIMIAVGAYCADTNEEANHIASPQIYKKTMTTLGNDHDPWISPDLVQDRLKEMTPHELIYYNKLKSSFIIGTPDQCQQRFGDLQKYWQTDEFAVLTVTHDFESRAKSYQLLAKALT